MGDTITYNAAIGACERGAREGGSMWMPSLILLPFVLARRVMSRGGSGAPGQRRRGWGFEMDTIAYNFAMSACEGGSRWTSSLKVLPFVLARGALGARGQDRQGGG